MNFILCNFQENLLWIQWVARIFFNVSISHIPERCCTTEFTVCTVQFTLALSCTWFFVCCETSYTLYTTDTHWRCVCVCVRCHCVHGEQQSSSGRIVEMVTARNERALDNSGTSTYIQWRSRERKLSASTCVSVCVTEWVLNNCRMPDLNWNNQKSLFAVYSIRPHHPPPSTCTYINNIEKRRSQQ